MEELNKSLEEHFGRTRENENRLTENNQQLKAQIADFNVLEQNLKSKIEEMGAENQDLQIQI